jgi:hypothetical protein
VHRPVALAGNKQLVAAKRHVHRLAADLDGGLLAERRIDQTHRVTLQAADANEAVVRAVAGDLRRLRESVLNDLFRRLLLHECLKAGHGGY